MVCFQTKNTTFGYIFEGIFSKVDWKMFIYSMAIGNILRTLGIFYDYLVLFVYIWYNFSGFGIVYQEKSGNPVQNYFAQT
jgi:hypothetical protein